MAHQSIVLGGGCFWCLDAAYRQVRGVREVISGYSGGTTKNPHYDEVSTGSSGHAEVVKVVFDPEQIQLKDILAIFWSIHDPTTLNRQGNDVGSQYRSCIYFEDEAQTDIIRESAVDAAALWDAPLTTEITHLEKFYPAEDYHQDYFMKNPESGYCQAIIQPKLAKMRAELASFLV